MFEVRCDTWARSWSKTFYILEEAIIYMDRQRARLRGRYSLQVKWGPVVVREAHA